MNDDRSPTITDTAELRPRPRRRHLRWWPQRQGRAQLRIGRQSPIAAATSRIGSRPSAAAAVPRSNHANAVDREGTVYQSVPTDSLGERLDDADVVRLNRALVLFLSIAGSG